MDLITYEATRYRCPHCRRSFAHRATAEKHEARCFMNVEVRSCKTCRHFTADRTCLLDVDLETARCPTCGGRMYPDGSGECTCPWGSGGGNPVYGLRVQCDVWEVGHRG